MSRIYLRKEGKQLIEKKIDELGEIRKNCDNEETMEIIDSNIEFLKKIITISKDLNNQPDTDVHQMD